jgi:hypothetical protein
MCGVVQNLERSAAGWLRGFDLVRYTTAIENEQQFCPDRIRFHLFQTLLLPNADGEFIPSTNTGVSKQKFRRSISAFHRPIGRIFDKERFSRWAAKTFKHRRSSLVCW